MHIKFIKKGEQYESRTKIPIKAIDGSTLAEMDKVPRVLVSNCINELKAGEEITLSFIGSCFKKAADIFQNGKPDGLDFNEYISKVHLVSGNPYSSLKYSVMELIDNLFTLPEYIMTQIPNGAKIATNINDTKLASPSVIWIKKGEVISVIAAGNHPLTNNGWLECLASGYKVVIKPSVSEPFTAYRLVNSLYEAGLPKEYLLYLPGGHEIVPEIINVSDFSLVYGGEQTVQEFKGSNKVIVRGPGRSKLFWDKNYVYHNLEHTKSAILDSILSDGGVKCVNTSGIIYTKDHRDQVKEIYEELLDAKSNGFFDQENRLPILSKDKAVLISDYVKHFAEINDVELLSKSHQHLYEEIQDGICVMNACVIKVRNMNQNILNFEMGCPIVWFYEMKDEKDLDYLRNSLVLRLMSHSQDMKNRFCLDYSVKKVILEFNKNSIFKNMPHDGYLLGHLFDAKGIY